MAECEVCGTWKDLVKVIYAESGEVCWRCYGHLLSAKDFKGKVGGGE